MARHVSTITLVTKLVDLRIRARRSNTSGGQLTRGIEQTVNVIRARNSGTLWAIARRLFGKSYANAIIMTPESPAHRPHPTRGARHPPENPQVRGVHRHGFRTGRRGTCRREETRRAGPAGRRPPGAREPVRRPCPYSCADVSPCAPPGSIVRLQRLFPDRLRACDQPRQPGQPRGASRPGPPLAPRYARTPTPFPQHDVGLHHHRVVKADVAPGPLCANGVRTFPPGLFHPFRRRRPPRRGRRRASCRPRRRR
ncbi:hypothetical protein QFZ82_006775 [Streptomyces sp. V4I23]|nr:hypothetical protein [Streptomyces sp. V4I23]